MVRGSFPGQNWEKMPLDLSPGKGLSLCPHFLYVRGEFSFRVQFLPQSGSTRRPLPFSSSGVRMVFKSLRTEATGLALGMSTRLLALQ